MRSRLGRTSNTTGGWWFAKAAHDFCTDELIEALAKDPSFTEDEAVSLISQVRARGYNPPRRQRIGEWQERQDFPICPNPNDPRACNVDRDLQFPEDVYEDIQDFYEELATERSGAGPSLAVRIAVIASRC